MVKLENGAQLRLRGRSRRQQDQRQTTRRNLLEAAKRQFTELSYTVTTIDDIAKDAGVSRTTFYRHFDSKWAIAQTLFAEVGAPIRLLHEHMAAVVNPTDTQIRQWLGKVLDVLDANKPLVQAMREADAIEPDSDEVVTATHDEMIRMFATHSPAFKAASSRAASNAEARTRAHLLLLQFDQFCYAVVVRKSIDREAAIRVMAQQFRRFIDLRAGRERGE